MFKYIISICITVSFTPFLLNAAYFNCRALQIKPARGLFFPGSTAAHGQRLISSTTRLFLNSKDEEFENDSRHMISRKQDDLSQLQKKATNFAIIERLLTSSFSLKEKSSLIQLELIGKGSVGPDDLSSKNCIFLAPKDSSLLGTTRNSYEYSQFLPMPLPASGEDGILKLLSFAYKGRPISKSLCLSLNPLLVNRDGALFDNLPYAKWTIDPLKRNRDAAQNPIDEKYHMGKRDAYNRFMGKDWYGRSLSIGNVAARIQYMLGEEEAEEEGGLIKEDANVKTLAERVLEMEVQESRMALAEAEEQCAILRAEIGDGGMDYLEEMSDEILLMQYEALEQGLKAVNDAKDSLEERQEALASFRNKGVEGGNSSSLFSLIALQDLVQGQKSDAPYRGASGYKPVIDTKDEMFQKSILPYSSPFEMMKEIINEQLNAEVIGCIIEDASLFQGSTIFGGGIAIQRKGRKKTLSLNGEVLELDDEDDDFGNDGIKKGETMIVECDFDEAIGMALACGVDIHMDRKEWDRSKIVAPIVFQKSNDGDPQEQSFASALPLLQSRIDTIVIETQGEGKMSQYTKIQAPRGRTGASLSFFNGLRTDQPVFDTNIPVQSLSEFDSLTVQDKAQLLLSLDSFKGNLPRPRALRRENNSNDNILNPLDELLLPLIDESVRRQVLIRIAEKNNDSDKVNELQKGKSRRQIAKENADLAREEGKDQLAEMWEKEAEFYAFLRADATQDEGSYSRFLDRDEWYERTRQKIAEKNRNKFRSLMDDMEQD